jgi:hypothetical protein
MGLSRRASERGGRFEAEWSQRNDTAGYEQLGSAADARSFKEQRQSVATSATSLRTLDIGALL